MGKKYHGNVFLRTVNKCKTYILFYYKIMFPTRELKGSRSKKQKICTQNPIFPKTHIFISFQIFLCAYMNLYTPYFCNKYVQYIMDNI